MLHNSIGNISHDLSIGLTVVHELCEIINTPRSLAVSLILQYQEWGEYLDLPMEHQLYEDPRHFALDYLVTEVLKKHPDIPLGIDRTQVAMEAFRASEAQCRRTNEFLRNHTPLVLERARWEVLKILGTLEERDLKYIESSFSFGPGASTGVSGKGSSLSDKYDKEIHLTTGLLPYYRSILGEQWWEHHRLSKNRVVEGSKFTTVPKSAKTDRGICVEPTLNMYVQKGIGKEIRRRLKRDGINLNTQERNRYLASIAHKENLATIDLSMASDSLSSQLILKLLPPRWVELLLLCRSDFTSLEDETVELEKWSSMGNGYTFELETLVFWSIVKSVVPRSDLIKCTVYGDDIIVPQQHAARLIDALNLLGFNVNNTKSFLAGNFFESCGHDYFKGLNVRPFHLKGVGNDKIPSALQIANKLRLYCHRLNCEQSCDDTFQPVWLNLIRKIPRVWRKHRVPASMGDTGLICSAEEAPTTHRARDGIEGYVVSHIIMTPMYNRKHTFGVLLANLAHLERRQDIFDFLTDDCRPCLFTKGKEPKRGFLGKPRARKTVVHQWSCGFDWQSPIY